MTASIQHRIARVTGVPSATVVKILELHSAMSEADADLALAREIAAIKSKQTGKNLLRYFLGFNDHAYGVQCALAGIKSAKETGNASEKEE